MILEHDGITVDFFETFPKDLHKIGIHLSGGADSALILFLLVKMAAERNQDLEIYPLNGFDINDPDADSEIPARKVIEHIRNLTGTKRIKDLMVYPIDMKDKTKGYYMRPARKYLTIKHGVTHFIFGTTQGMDHKERPVDHEGSGHGQQLIDFANKYPEIMVPWAHVNKKFIAAQYDKFYLKELSNLTNSCTASSSYPCKKCWWCEERYWAFNSYDGGVQ